MLKFQAHHFVNLMRSMALFEAALDRMLDDCEQSGNKVVVTHTEDDLRFAEDDPRRTLESADYSLAAAEGEAEIPDLLNWTEIHCRKLGLQSAIDKIGRMRRKLVGQTSLADLLAWFRELQERIEDEWRGRTFLYVPPERARYFDAGPAFGEVVYRRFPQATTDIEEATLCMGCGRHTAAVLHLMRVMEYGVRHMAIRLLRVPKEKVVGAPWGRVLREIDGAIRVLPTATDTEIARQERFQEIAIHLQNAKDAWRNPAMHPDRIFTEEQAERIHASVRTFMVELAGIR